jgi:hypothetical protein
LLHLAFFVRSVTPARDWTNDGPAAKWRSVIYALRAARMLFFYEITPSVWGLAASVTPKTVSVNETKGENGHQVVSVMGDNFIFPLCVFSVFRFSSLLFTGF